MLPGNKTKAWSRKSDKVCVCRETHESCGRRLKKAAKPSSARSKARSTGQRSKARSTDQRLDQHITISQVTDQKLKH